MRSRTRQRRRSSVAEDLLQLQRTTATLRDYARALLVAWPEASKASAGVLWAQYALETGRGAACWNWNIGNVKHVAGDGHDYVMLPSTWEIVGGKRVTFQPPDPQTWFRAYGSLDDAMVEHVAFLRRKYAPAWNAVESGEPERFASLLKAHGYYTGSEADYRRALSSLHAEWMLQTAYDNAAAALAPTEPVPGAPIVEEDGGAARRDTTTDAVEEAARAEVDGRSGA